MHSDGNRSSWAGSHILSMLRIVAALLFILHGKRFIPIVLLALLAQLIAPVGAFRAVAHAVSDPLYLASICSSASSHSNHSLPSEDSAAHVDCCVACGTGVGGAIVVPRPQPVFIGLHRQYQQIVWLEAWEALPAIRTASNAQARAPPGFS